MLHQHFYFEFDFLFILQAKPDTWKGYDPHKMTMAEVFEKFGLDSNTADFTGLEDKMLMCVSFFWMWEC